MIKSQFINSFSLDRDNISSFNSYPYNLPVVKLLDRIALHEKVTFFIGENGTGKSTLLEALAVKYGFNAEGGSKNFNFATQETHSVLADNIRISKGILRPKDGFFFRAESFYNVASNIDKLQEESGMMLDSYGGKSLHEQSHGESFFSLFIHRLFGNGIYILDEPEAALSPQRQYAFLVRLHDLIKQNSQFIIATHSPIILAYPNAKIIEITDDGYQEVSYKDSDHYQQYKTFLDAPEFVLHSLGIK